MMTVNVITWMIARRRDTQIADNDISVAILKREMPDQVKGTVTITGWHDMLSERLLVQG